MFFKASKKRKYYCRKLVSFKDSNGNLKTITTNFCQHYTRKEAVIQSIFDEKELMKDSDVNNIHRINDISIEYDNFIGNDTFEHIRLEYIAS